jgi:hypothetical protein
MVPTLTSFPRRTSMPPSRSLTAGASAKLPVQSGVTFRAWVTVPAASSLVPGDPIPTPASSSTATPACSAASRTASTIASATPAGPASFGVGLRACPSTW